MAVVFASVAEERDRIATEPPVDLEALAASWTLEGTFVAVAGTELLGSVHVDVNRHGYGDLNMAVAREWRGLGVGSALMVAAIEWARQGGLHKLSLSVWPHNAAAIALYRKYGFVEEGRRIKQIRRQSRLQPQNRSRDKRHPDHCQPRLRRLRCFDRSLCHTLPLGRAEEGE
jgi:ribosomal-protein-alanine N-acetyltransferase